MVGHGGHTGSYFLLGRISTMIQSQFAIYSQDSHYAEAIRFIRQHKLANEIHLNRVRFWVPTGPILTEFLLRFESYHVVTIEEDLATGQILKS